MDLMTQMLRAAAVALRCRRPRPETCTPETARDYVAAVLDLSLAPSGRRIPVRLPREAGPEAISLILTFSGGAERRLLYRPERDEDGLAADLARLLRNAPLPGPAGERRRRG